MPTFTDEPWNTPESDLSADDFCSLCLIDLNESGQEKVKAKCKLPVRKMPSGAVNRNALRNAAARLPQTDAPAEAKRKAARSLMRLMKQAGIEPGEMTRKMAGM